MSATSDEPAVRMTRTRDGIGIAYYVIGDGRPLVHSPPYPRGHLRVEWKNPYCRAYLLTLAKKHRLVRYDGRGSGLSDREVVDYSLEAQIHDLESVVERLRLERFSLFAFGHLGPAYITYAVRNPGRVSHLILWCSYARSSDYSESPRVQAAWSIIEKDWEMYSQLEGYRGTEWTGGDEARWYAYYLTNSVFPHGLRAAFDGLQGIDVSDLLPRLQVPTLVMHRAESHVLTAEMAKELASRIPNAELAIMEGPWRSPFQGDVEAVLRRIDEFLGGPPGGSLLSAREGEILGLLAHGMSSREIGRELALSVRTVERHITNIYRKIDAHSRAQATAYAFEHGLVRPS